jgi:hypothetical protein
MIAGSVSVMIWKLIMTEMDRVIAAEARAHIKGTTTAPAQAVVGAEATILTGKDCLAWTWGSMRSLIGLETVVDSLSV